MDALVERLGGLSLGRGPEDVVSLWEARNLGGVHWDSRDEQRSYTRRGAQHPASNARLNARIAVDFSALPCPSKRPHHLPGVWLAGHCDGASRPGHLIACLGTMRGVMPW